MEQANESGGMNARLYRLQPAGKLVLQQLFSFKLGSGGCGNCLRPRTKFDESRIKTRDAGAVLSKFL